VRDINREREKKKDHKTKGEKRIQEKSPIARRSRHVSNRGKRKGERKGGGCMSPNFLDQVASEKEVTGEKKRAEKISLGVRHPRSQSWDKRERKKGKRKRGKSSKIT